MEGLKAAVQQHLYQAHAGEKSTGQLQAQQDPGPPR